MKTKIHMFGKGLKKLKRAIERLEEEVGIDANEVCHIEIKGGQHTEVMVSNSKGEGRGQGDVGRVTVETSGWTE